MITHEFVLERTRQLFNTAPSAHGPIEVGVYEFDLGFVTWPVEPDPTDWSKPPAMIGGSVIVVDRETGQPSIWPRLAAPQVAELYRAAKNAA
jgi:hypothetical protein